jgi:hypothetical protein
MVVAVTALVVALGGVAGAQAGLIGPNQLANNAVQTRHIAGNAVTTTDIAGNAVTAADIKNGTIATADLATGAVRSADIAPGAVTPDRIAGGPSVAATRIGNADAGGSGVLIPNAPCANFVLPKWSTTNGHDTGGFLHSSGTYLVVPRDGIYSVSVTIPWDDTPGGWRFVGVGIDPTVGPSSTIGQARADALTATDGNEGLVQTVQGTVEARAGDTIGVGLTSCWHTASVGFATDTPAQLNADWVRPLVG